MVTQEFDLLNVDWFITRNCDQAKHCRFYFAPWNVFPQDVNLDEAKHICDRLAELEVKTVTLCGGEPTLYPHIADIVQELRLFGIKVVFYTNLATNYDIVSLFPHIHTLSIPIDAFSPDIIKKMRGFQQFNEVRRFLKKLRLVDSCPIVKVGTVVTRLNINDLKNIFWFIEKYGVVNIWRLYQFSPCGIGKKNERRFLVADAEFYQAVDSIKILAKESNLDIAERSRDDTIGYCRIMDSAGRFYRYEEKYIPLDVTIFDEPQRILTGYNNTKNIKQKAWHHSTLEKESNKHVYN